MSRNRTKKGQFTKEPETESSTTDSKPNSRKPVTERAADALEYVLDAAIASGDHEKILDASKLFSQFRRSGSSDDVDPLRERMDFIIRSLSTEDRIEVKEILFRAHVIYAATGLRLGLRPMFGAAVTPEGEARILEAARERVARRRDSATRTA